MINIKIEKTTYKIPNKLTELTIGVYQKLNGLDKSNQATYYGELLNRLGGIPYDVVRNMTVKQVRTIATSLNDMLDQFGIPLQDKVTVQGIEYKFPDKLDMIRYDQFIDMWNMTNGQTVINDNLHLIAALLYSRVTLEPKPKFKWYKFWKKRVAIETTEPYDSKTVEARAMIFKEHMTMDVVFGLLIFFSHLKLISLKNSQDSLIKDIEKEKMKSKTIPK